MAKQSKPNIGRKGAPMNLRRGGIHADQHTKKRSFVDKDALWQEAACALDLDCTCRDCVSADFDYYSA